jgi:hypothetical protein
MLTQLQCVAAMSINSTSTVKTYCQIPALEPLGRSYTLQEMITLIVLSRETLTKHLKWGMEGITQCQRKGAR